MHKAQLARLPAAEGRRTERRLVNLAASLREPGAELAEAEVLNLSSEGFMAVTPMKLEPDAVVWLKLAGTEALKSRVVWVEDDKAGFEFATPIHPGLLNQLVQSSRKPLPLGHFGPRRGTR